jgi:ribosomal protein S18 acetylase RimI-like enzyme
MLLVIPEWSDWRNGTVLWVHSVYVKVSHRRQGVYRQLYSYLQKLVSQSDHLRGIRLYVEKENKRAQATYQELGMSNDHYDLYEWMKHHF